MWGQDGWILARFMDLDFVSVHKHAKKERGQYPATLTEQTRIYKTSVVDPNLELKGGWGWGCLIYMYLPSWLFPLCHFFFFIQNKRVGGGGPHPPGPSPRSTTEPCPCEIEVPYLILSNTRTMSSKYFNGFIEDFSHLVWPSDNSLAPYKKQLPS